tara:strand:- start:94 stop:261 length:168 start_codon:yes stop_codon:yes gene_type:complete
MPKFKVINTYKYTAEVIVEADSENEALQKAFDMEDAAQGDDWLYDSEAKLVMDAQ